MRYNTPNTPMDQLRDFVKRGGAPVTMTILAVNIVTFLAAFFSPSLMLPFLVNEVAFSVGSVLHAPWTLVTYPLVSIPPFSFWMILNWLFLWLTGSSLERGWGSTRYGVFFLGVTAASSLSLLVGGLLLHMGAPPLSDVFLPLTGLIVAFCMLNPEQSVTVYFFPVKAKYLAIGVTVWTYLNYGTVLKPTLALFALGGILAAYLYVRFARPWDTIGYYSAPRQAFRGPDLSEPRSGTAKSRPTFRTTLDGSPQKRGVFDVRGRVRDWRDRRRLEKLWKNSGLSGSEPEWRDDEKRRR